MDAKNKIDVVIIDDETRAAAKKIDIKADYGDGTGAMILPIGIRAINSRGDVMLQIMIDVGGSRTLILSAAADDMVPLLQQLTVAVAYDRWDWAADAIPDADTE